MNWIYAAVIFLAGFVLGQFSMLGVIYMVSRIVENDFSRENIKS